ncbi:MAG: helix-turn-helix transcriptional regulator, partial [Prochlorococcaceae cyanobacterium]
MSSGNITAIARLRRRWRLEDVAERMGVTRYTVADVERGKPGTSVAAYLGALWVLGLLD